MKDLRQSAQYLNLTLADIVNLVGQGEITTVNTKEGLRLSLNDLEAYLGKVTAPDVISNEESSVFPIKTIVDKVSKPSVPVVELIPEWKQKVIRVLGEDKTELYLSKYDRDQVVQITSLVVGWLGGGDQGYVKATSLFGADEHESIINVDSNVGTSLRSYNKAIMEIFHSNEYMIPIPLSIENVPEQYLPRKINQLKEKLPKVNSCILEQNVDELCDKLRDELYEVIQGEDDEKELQIIELVEGLIDEGHDVLYTHAVLKGGFKIHSTKKKYVGPSSGQGGTPIAKPSQRKNIAGYLGRGNVDTSRIDNTIDRLRRQEVLIASNKTRVKDILMVNSGWSNVTEDVPFLRKYLDLHLGKNGN